MKKDGLAEIAFTIGWERKYNSMIDIKDELSKNFIDYTYEVNSQRAFPDVRDGLKPSQRACLWEMYTKGYTSDKKHIKSAKISGGVAQAWSPHGTAATYETFVRMSQPWINAIPEVDWHGSNGNVIIGPEPASERYTEARLSKAAEDGLLRGLKKNNVPMKLNYLEEEYWPEVFPAVFPRLIVNGSQGIGSTIAQTWLNYNLQEVADVICNYIDSGKLDYSHLYPDFPSGGILINKTETLKIPETGKGKAIIRGKAEIKGKSIFITELPYQVYVEPFIDEVKKLIADNNLAIEDIFNKSDKNHPIVIEIVCEGDPHYILNYLFNSTSLQKSYSANQMALLGKTPIMFTLKKYIDAYIKHNEECIKREYQFDKEKAQARKEIVDGLLKALASIDEIIALIKGSESASAAKANLMKPPYKFTERQASAIVDMKLGKLAHLEAIELNKENAELDKTLKICDEFLSNENRRLIEVKARLEDFTKKYSIPRRTRVLDQEVDLKASKTVEAIEDKNCLVLIDEQGKWKRIDIPKTAKRNTVGLKNGKNIITSVISTNLRKNLYLFDDKGKMYIQLVNNIPEEFESSGYTNIMACFSEGKIPSSTSQQYVLFATKQGLVKKVPINEYLNVKRSSGVISITLNEGDQLIGVMPCHLDDDILLVTKHGGSIVFHSADLPESSRTAKGVIGIKLGKDDEVCSLTIIHKSEREDGSTAVVINGLYGKRVPLSELLAQNRGGKGKTLSPKEVEVVGVFIAKEQESLYLVGDKSSLTIKVGDLPLLNKTALGNKVLKNNNYILKASLI